MIESADNAADITNPDAPAPEEKQLENSLRPRSLEEYIGQETLKTNLRIVLDAAQQRGDQLEHALFYGPPGLGKTTLANILARECKVNLRTTSGPAIQRAGDLAAILTNLEEGDMLFIDEIHRLNKIVEEVLYPAMEDGALDIVIGKGPGARTIRMDLPHFTIIGATTRIGLISAPLRDRFGLTYHLDYYTSDELQEIIMRSAYILRISIDPNAALTLATKSRFTPRIANRLLKRVRDFSQVRGHDTISASLVDEALGLLGVDGLGLDKNDRRILETLIDKFNGGPVVLSTLAAATGEEQDTVADVYEPFLLRQGLLMRTAKGRQATEHAYTHLKRVSSKPSTLL